MNSAGFETWFRYLAWTTQELISKEVPDMFIPGPPCISLMLPENSENEEGGLNESS